MVMPTITQIVPIPDNPLHRKMPDIATSFYVIDHDSQGLPQAPVNQ